MMPSGRAGAFLTALAFFVASAVPLSAGATQGSISVSAHISPHSMRVGETATIEIAVVTPPDHRILPLALPQDLRDLEIESAETLPIAKQGDRWTHSIRVRFRPHEIGRLAWPNTELAIETPDGAAARRTLERVPFEVRSILHLYGGRSEPFGARQAPPLRAAGLSATFVTLAIVGVAALLALLVVRRRRSTRRKPGLARTAHEDPWTIALNDLGNAGNALDPGTAASRTAEVLRRYMERRFGASTLTLTTEELADATPPFGAISRWPAFTTLLFDLDTLRFSPRNHHDASSKDAGRIDELLDRSREFVEASLPPEALR